MDPEEDGAQEGETLIFRALQRWYARNQHRIPMALCVSAEGIGARVILEGVHPAIGVRVLPHTMCVSLDLDGENWDQLMWEDTVPAFDGVDWWCDICRNEGRHVAFKSLDALWQDHFFDPLANWIRDVLVPANYAVLRGSYSEGATWVELSREARWPVSKTGAIALRLHRGRQTNKSGLPGV